MSRRSTTVMMRIAIAGGGGFADILARELSQSAHALLVLSTVPHPEFESDYDCQVVVVDYSNVDALRFALQGVDLVISTISGAEQVNLIDAARRARVRCFVPSEFEGALSHRPTDPDPLDRGSSTALDWLQRWASSRSHPMRFTVFSCGIFYERFAPGGLMSCRIGASWHIQNQGDYMLDLDACTAVIPQANAQGRPVHISLTSVSDVARFVAAAVELGIENWPREFKMRGARVTTQRLVEICQEVRGVQFTIESRPYEELLEWVRYYEETQDWPRWYQWQHLVQTANGRYSLGDPNLNDMVDFRPVGLRTWLEQVWGPAE
ncbi:hypothetical protein BJ170DRAFT_190321 [Xylariales sp. AK1849]|nr:hypothetical protein BJ170DRAFT_190321 [Xylariales sp. AK1849]